MQAKIRKHKDVEDGGLAEIYQSMNTKMAILVPIEDVDLEFERITPLVICRDFLVDVYTFSKVKKDFKIYGCNVKTSKIQPVDDGTYFQIQFPDKDAKNNFEKNFKFLCAIERKNSIAPSIALQVKNDDLSVVVLGDRAWLASCLSVALYTSLLRCFSYRIEGNDWIEGMPEKDSKGECSTDHRLVHSVARETWDKILSDLGVLDLPEFCGFDPQKDQVGTIHHNSGFYSVFGTHRELNKTKIKNNTHWKHFKDAGWKLHTS